MADNKQRVTQIKVRMYRQGFGDCFLLQFFAKTERVFTMLIDCGIKLNTRRDECPIERVMDDLRRELAPQGKKGGPPTLDVLVATHEHWDHIAFFHPKTTTKSGSKSQDLFADFVIQQVWLAWTEDPENPRARQLNSRLRDGARALQMAALKLQQSTALDSGSSTPLNDDQTPDARTAFNRGVAEVVSFYGLDAALQSQPLAASGSKSLKTEEALKNVIKLGKKHGRVHYFQPETLVTADNVPPGIRVYVLGPPGVHDDDKLLKKSNPSAGDRKETYLNLDQAGFAGFVDGLLALSDGNSVGPAAGASTPFGAGIGLPLEKANQDHYLRETYFRPGESYRKIDHTWLDAAGQFALQLDGAVNNTSLVLAIEFEDSEKVLLFPGDAQVGSWLSWHNLKWEVQSGSGKKTKTATDLLNNTVLYKVSHHGSHNATLREKGLELMTHPDLVALIPEQEKQYRGIIDKELMNRLEQRCRGRVIVSADSKLPAEALLKKTRPAELDAQGWTQFQKNLKITDTYVEYTIEG
jgi:hypothetical protein